jgi:hypothetical protein
MRKFRRTLAFASAFAAAMLAVSTLNADNPRDKRGPMMGHSNMMGKQMSRMGEMMEGCSRMMGDRSNKPNDQWRRQLPSAPEKKS